MTAHPKSEWVDFRNLSDPSSSKQLARSCNLPNDDLSNPRTCRIRPKSDSLQREARASLPTNPSFAGANPSKSEQPLFSSKLLAAGTCYTWLSMATWEEELEEEEQEHYRALARNDSSMQGLELNDTLGSLELSCTSLYGNDEANNRLLAPLAFNRGLKRLVLRNNRPPKGPNVPPYCWPRFDFMADNHDLEHLTIEAWRSATPFEQGFASLCMALHRNRGLTTLDLSKYPLQTCHIDALTEMIGHNSGLHKMDVSGGYISGADHLKFVSQLARNTTLKVLVLTPYSALAKNVTSTCSEIATFVKGVLTQSNLKSLEVGPCSARYLEPLLPILATNYCLEHLIFHQSCGFSGEKKGTESEAAKEMQKRINVMTALNKAGGRYLVDVGPECKAAGVNVLDRVSNSVDCLFTHLRENPSLCADGGADAKRGNSGVSENTQTVAAKELQKRINKIAKLNKAGRHCLVEYRTLCSLFFCVCQVYCAEANHCLPLNRGVKSSCVVDGAYQPVWPIKYCAVLFVVLAGLLAARRRRRRRALLVVPPRARADLGYVQFCRQELRARFAVRYANAHGARDQRRVAEEAHHYLTNDLALVRPLIWVERVLR